MNNEEIREMVKWIGEYDYYSCGDQLYLELGGDGDNGEHLIYLIERYFAFKEQENNSIYAGT